ncbi:MAG: MarR family winged helix-turn-helix transcriptional regulator [Thermomicrobiales bacterium]
MSRGDAVAIDNASKTVQAPARAALLVELGDVLRLASGQGVMFSEAMAKRIGINPTDLECLGLLEQYGPLTAGRLAELTGLTTGAITGLVDRLERRGYVERERDPGDRRRVIVRLLPDHLPRDLAAYDDMNRGMNEVCARYSDDELRLIIDFMRRAFAVVQEATAKLQES